MSTITGNGPNASVTFAKIRNGSSYFRKDLNTTHSEIKVLQTALQNWGFYSQSLDGVYGNSTEASVKGFQQEFDLEIDGCFGSSCLKKLESLTGTLTDDHTVTPTLASVQNGLGYFQIGHSGSAVNQLREYLHLQGITCALTGSYDSNFAEIIKSFQRQYGLTADGCVGQVTLAVLMDTAPNSSVVSGSTVRLTAGKLARAGFKDVMIRPEIVSKLNNALTSYQLANVQVIRHFLAQAMYETGSGQWMLEQSYTPGVGSNAIYSPYCGAGFHHLTWSAHYQYFKDSLPQSDSRIVEPKAYATVHVAVNYPAESACWHWNYKNISSEALANDKTDKEKVVKITELVSGSNSTAAERYDYFSKISSIIN